MPIVQPIHLDSRKEFLDSWQGGVENFHLQSYSYITWDQYKVLQNLNDLPIIPKGIMTVEDAKLAVANGAPAIILSNHGGRQLNGSPSGLEVAMEIHEKATEIFSQIEVYADGGVRYGVDVLKMLALGIKAVCLGRPFMYANIYGAEGVAKVVDILKKKLANKASNLDVGDLKQINLCSISLAYIANKYYQHRTVCSGSTEDLMLLRLVNIPSTAEKSNMKTRRTPVVATIAEDCPFSREEVRCHSIQLRMMSKMTIESVRNVVKSGSMPRLWEEVLFGLAFRPSVL